MVPTSVETTPSRGSVRRGGASRSTPNGRQALRRGLRRFGLSFASLAVTIVVIELAILVEVINPLYIPQPSTIFARLGRELTTVDLWAAIGASLWHAAAGLALGSFFAVISGLLLGTIPMLERAVNPVIEFLRPIPSIAILPLVILSLGIGHMSVILLASISSFWLVLVLTIQGARSVDPLTRDALKVYGLDARHRFFRLTLPTASPYIVTGTRIAGAVAIIVAISSELLGGMPGVGRLVLASEVSGDRVGMFAYIVVAGLLGLTVNFVLERVEARLLSWHPSQQQGVA